MGWWAFWKYHSQMRLMDSKEVSFFFCCCCFVIFNWTVVVLKTSGLHNKHIKHLMSIY